jgi:hypothetical protein
MNIDKGSFLILVVTLGAGGAGGYFASQRHLFGPLPAPPAPPPEPPKESASAASVAPPPPAPPPRPAPTCDDAIGTPAACPPPGYPADEGGCGAFPTKRCNEFKQAMRPRVAESAVACLNALTPAQRCDPIRVGLCAHTALMNACSVGEAVDPEDAAADDVTTRCNSIVRGCEGVKPGPTLLDCRATLAGMSVQGRDKMVGCMKTHCSDKGLLWCEAALDVK